MNCSSPGYQIWGAALEGYCEMILQLLRRALMPFALRLLHANAGLGLDFQGLEMARIFLPCARHPCRRFLQSTSRVPRLQGWHTPNYFGSASQAPSEAPSPCTRGYRSFEIVHLRAVSAISKRCDRSHSKRADSCETRKCSSQWLRTCIRVLVSYKPRKTALYSCETRAEPTSTDSALKANSSKPWSRRPHRNR